VPIQSAVCNYVILITRSQSDTQTLAQFWLLDVLCPSIMLTYCAYIDRNILNDVKIKITQSLAPVNLHSSISVMWRFRMYDRFCYLVKHIFRNIDATANSAVHTNNLLCISQSTNGCRYCSYASVKSSCF